MLRFLFPSVPLSAVGLAILLALPARAQWVDTGGSIHTSDDVGVGVTTPSSPLHLVPSSAGEALRIHLSQDARQHFGVSFGSVDVSQSRGLTLTGWNGQPFLQTTYGDNKTHLLDQSGITVTSASGSVGIGTTSPDVLLHVGIESTGTVFRTEYEPDSRQRFEVAFADPSSAPGNRGVVLSGWKGRPFLKTAYGDNQTHILDQSGISITSASGLVGIGTTSPSEKLSVNGKVRSKEVIVENSNWPDFVFEPGYDLRSLDAVAAFVDANGHLPGVPNASDVAQSGQHVGATQATLLQKIEELTLYAIDQHERAETLQRSVDALQQKMDAQQKQHQQEIDALRRTLQTLQTQLDAMQTTE